MNFQQDVIEKSYEKPVLVDFWAPWCGPCRVLGPVLEQLAEEQPDRWTLVKINTEEEQALAQQFGIRSIPNVKLFYQGEVVDEFAGALPKFQIERWLDQHIPDERSGELANLLLAIGNGQRPLEDLKEYVANHPDMTIARLALAEAIVFQQPEEVESILQQASLDAQQIDLAQDIRTLAELMLFETDDSKAGQALQDAQEALRTHESELAIKRIIDAVMADRSLHKDLPRRAAIALFHLWGNEHELTKRFRRLFDMALY